MPRYRLATRAAAFRSSDVRELLRHAGGDVVSLAGGLPAAELFDVEGLREASAAALREAPVQALQYGSTEGQLALREQLLRRLREDGVPTAGRSLLVTTGSQQGLDLVARLLVDEGDTVVVQRPTYLAALQAFSLAGAQFVGLEEDEEGLRLEALEALAARRKPKLVYLVSHLANPSTVTLSTRRREQLLAWAAHHQVFVLEDDPYGVLRTDGVAPPGLLALAQRVPGAAAWCGLASTLSKSVAPGLRIGWLLLPAALGEAACRLKQAFDLHTPSFTQEVAARYLASGRLQPHLQRVREAYRERRQVLAGALRSHFGAALQFTEPEGGMFLWARLAGTDTRALLPRAQAMGVVYVPGDAFYADWPESDRLRLNFTGEPADRLREGAARLHRAWTGMREGGAAAPLAAAA